MGNYKFRSSHKMSNAWFYNLLRDLITPTKNLEIRSKNRSPPSPPPPAPPPPSPEHHQQQLKPKRYSASAVLSRHHLSSSRKSYHYTRKSVSTLGAPAGYLASNLDDETATPLPDPPRKSPKKKSSTKYSSSSSSSNTTASTSTSSSSLSSAAYQCRRTTDTAPDETFPSENASLDLLHPEFSRFPLPPKSRVPCPDSPRCRTDQDLLPDDHDIIATFDVGKEKHNNQRESSSSIELKNAVSSIELAPIIARPEKFNGSSVRLVVTPPSSTRRRLSSSISCPSNNRVRLRVKSPIFMNTSNCGRRRSVSGSRRIRKSAVAGSFAVVKSSSDPRRDFRESMVEMILANEMKEYKELEELLDCYLSLNSNEYHCLIVEVFKQIIMPLMQK